MSFVSIKYYEISNYLHSIKSEYLGFYSSFFFRVEVVSGRRLFSSPLHNFRFQSPVIKAKSSKFYSFKMSFEGAIAIPVAGAATIATAVTAFYGAKSARLRPNLILRIMFVCRKYKIYFKTFNFIHLIFKTLSISISSIN